MFLAMFKCQVFLHALMVHITISGDFMAVKCQ